MATESSEHDSEFITTVLCHLSEDSGVLVCLQVPLSSPELGFVFSPSDPRTIHSCTWIL